MILKTEKKQNLTFSQCERKAAEYYQHNNGVIPVKDKKIYSIRTITTIVTLIDILKQFARTTLQIKTITNIAAINGITKQISENIKITDTLISEANSQLSMLDKYQRFKTEFNAGHFKFTDANNMAIDSSNNIYKDFRVLMESYKDMLVAEIECTTAQANLKLAEIELLQATRAQKTTQNEILKLLLTISIYGG